MLYVPRPTGLPAPGLGALQPRGWLQMGQPLGCSRLTRHVTASSSTQTAACEPSSQVGTQRPHLRPEVMFQAHGFLLDVQGTVEALAAGGVLADRAVCDGQSSGCGTGGDSVARYAISHTWVCVSRGTRGDQAWPLVWDGTREVPPGDQVHAGQQGERAEWCVRSTLGAHAQFAQLGYMYGRCGLYHSPQ